MLFAKLVEVARGYKRRVGDYDRRARQAPRGTIDRSENAGLAAAYERALRDLEDALGICIE